MFEKEKNSKQLSLSDLLKDVEPELKISDKQFKVALENEYIKNKKSASDISYADLKRKTKDKLEVGKLRKELPTPNIDFQKLNEKMNELKIKLSEKYSIERFFYFPFVNMQGDIIKPAKTYGEQQQLFLTGGLVGAGKTTTKLSFSHITDLSERIVDIDIDNYRPFFSGDSNNIHKFVSQLGKMQRDYAVSNNFHLCYDSTMSGRFNNYEALIDRTIANGGEVYIAYVYTKLETSSERMFKRADNPQNKRDVVPFESLVKAHKSSLPNFLEIYDKYIDNKACRILLSDNNECHKILLDTGLDIASNDKIKAILNFEHTKIGGKYVFKNYEKTYEDELRRISKKYEERNGFNQPIPKEREPQNGNIKSEDGKIRQKGNFGNDRKKSPSGLIDFFYSKISTGVPVGNNLQLTTLAENFIGSRFSGEYNIQYLYDYLETAVNKHIIDTNKDLLKISGENALDKIDKVLSLLPTQNIRTKEKDDFQQFSTSPNFAYLVAKASQSQRTDIVLEPSAGNGSLISFLSGNVQKIYANEIDNNRASNLEFLGFEVSTHNAEIINSLLAPEVKPSLIVMNPPFSATGGRVKRHDNNFGFKHVQAALDRLEDNGRLVALLSEGMQVGRPNANKFWDSLKDNYTIQASIGISGDHYAKYGTNFGISLTVIDKIPNINNTRPVYQGYYEDIKEALNAIENFPSRVEPVSSQHFSGRDRLSFRDNEQLDRRHRHTSELDNGAEFSNDRGNSPERKQKSRQISIFDKYFGDREPSNEKRNSTRNNDELHRKNYSIENIDFHYPVLEAPITNLKEVGGFIEYAPAWIENLSEHPGNIVETKSMNGVKPPKPIHIPKLPKNILENISSLQLESVIYAGQRHNTVLPNGKTAGFFVGDGTGLGKGRTIASIICDNFNSGRKKALWVSVSQDLKESAKTDFSDIGFNVPCISLNDFQKEEKIALSEGTLFCTYQSLISGNRDYETSRLKQIVDWLGKDGVIVFDEAHKAKNLYSGERGKPSQTGIAVWDLQEKYLPTARVVYSSATGATTPADIAYATRLGLWGEGAYFDSYEGFLSEIGTRGIGAMEMVARDMKSLGMYNARSISFEGVEYRETIHSITSSQKEMYDATARAWQSILQNVNDVTNVIGADKKDISDSVRAYWGAHQKFYKKLTTSMKVPTAIKRIEEELENGNSVIVSIINTYEQATELKVSEAIANNVSLSEIDITPRSTIADYLYRSFPVDNFEVYTDENGKERTRKITDQDGNPIPNPVAVKMRDKMIDDLSLLNIPESPLDQIINYFELKAKNENDTSLKVAELTGRNKRIFQTISKNNDGRFFFTGEKEYKKRVPKDVSSKSQNLWEMENFQSGKKRIAIISKAASTGISLHASNTCQNKQKRVHITLEFGWSADEQLQTFGRSHRSNQAQPPTYDLLCTDIGGEKRFISIIANRLATLGAMTRGDRKSASGGDLNKYDFMSKYGTASLYQTYHSLPLDILKKMDLLDSENNIKKEVLSDVSKFLNRLLVLEVDEQNNVFEGFLNNFENAIVQDKIDGKLDEGLVDIKALSVEIKNTSVIREDSLTKAKTIYYELKLLQETKKLTWDFVQKMSKGFYIQKNSGNIVSYDSLMNTTNPNTGEIFKRIKYSNPANNSYVMNQDEFLEKYENIDVAVAKQKWDEKISVLGDTEEKTLHIIAGTILPIYKEINTENLKVIRTETDSGERIVGIQIPSKEISQVLQNLAIKREVDLSSLENLFVYLDEGEKIKLGEEFYLEKTKYLGQDLIEIKNYNNIEVEQFPFLRTISVNERDNNWKQRFFVPIGEAKKMTCVQELIKKFGIKND